MRQVVLDTETTGLSHGDGHRVVEIGCVELINSLPTGRVWQRYLNPERAMPSGAEAIHGLTDAFLGLQPRFAEVCEDFLAFIGEDDLVIHNAEFDIGFLNAELTRLGRPPLPMRRAIDTVQIARRKFPGAQASLDALCRRFQIDASARALHGALCDANLLAEVYLELIGGRQPALALAAAAAEAATAVAAVARPPSMHAPTPEELARHAEFLKKISAPIWLAD